MADRETPLSPREEVTLRRIALGYVERKDLSAVQVRRLMRLGLVQEDEEQELVLTPAGRTRYETLVRPLDLTPDTPNDLERLFALLSARGRH